MATSRGHAVQLRAGSTFIDLKIMTAQRLALGGHGMIQQKARLQWPSIG